MHFYLLYKVISFDQDQERLFRLKPPVIIIGSAGSGKTVLTLEKLKTLKGDVLYVTLSPFLVENSTSLYYANHYENNKQEIDFLSYKDFLETLRVIWSTWKKIRWLTSIWSVSAGWSTANPGMISL